MEKVLKYTENGVNFDSVKIPQILYEHGPLGRKGKIEYNDDEVTHIDDKSFINAVDIDWNGIEVENNNRINTTADLINWIKNKISNTSNIELEEISVPATCYRWYNINATPIIPIQNIKNPQSEDNEAAFPEYNWSEYAINRPEGQDWVLYLCSGTKTISTNTYSWESITRISGIDGSAGEDSNEREWIYKTFTQQQTFSSNNNNPSYWNISQQSDYLGPNGYQWSDNPQGVSIKNKFEYTSYRDYKNGSWTKFSQPILWSHYGVNGIDGDGVEYCYIRTKSKSIPEVQDNGNHYEDEYLPIVRIETLANYNNSDGPDIIGKDDTYFQNGYSYAKCTDNPVGVDNIYQYEWVITRTKQDPDEQGKRQWNNYSGKMSLWSSWTINVNPAITIKDGFLWGDGDYIRDGDGNPIKIEGGDGSQGVETIGCPEGDKTYKPGTISVCENKVKIYYNGQWIDFGEGSGSGKYIHIAYAKSINFDEHTYDGFSTTNSNDGTIYDWMGIMFNDSIDDTKIASDNTNDPDGTLWNAFKQYKWNYIKGRDGNGVEYIFLLTKEEVTKPGIDENPYVDNERVSHNKQDDEFLPRVTNYDQQKYQSPTWTDDPQQGVSAEWPKLWKAIRKKVNGVWQSFGVPKKENQYFAQTSAYVITSDNDNILLDDQSTSIANLESASSGTLNLIYNNTPVINDNNNNLIWECWNNNLSSLGLEVYINNNNFKLKYSEGNTPPEKFPVSTEQQQYYFKIRAELNNKIVAQKQFNVIIKDISTDGSFYKIIIQNDSQSYKSDETPNNNSNPIISVHKIKDGKSEQITEGIKLINNSDITTSLSEKSGITLVIPNKLYEVNDNSTLPLTLTNGVVYNEGGYDIALYYNKELLGAEHIDCIKDGKDGKDGKDASISDGITIKSITRYYQAKASDQSYVPSHKGNKDDGKDGWYGTQSAAGWSASNPYLYIQDKTIYNNDDESWGPVELYSYWGNENYDLVVSPQHIILDEKVNEENENRSYSGTNKVTVTLYKSGTENTIITKITNDSFTLGSSSVTDNEITISVNNNNLSEGYLSFTIKGYEVYENENSPFVFIRQVKVPVYINRAESALFRVEGELKQYAVEQDGLRETTYNAKIEATQKTLRSEYTEKIKYVEDRGRNLFGFNKDINWQPYTTLNPVIPFIQGYGIVVKNTGAINNIGIEKLTEDTETESFGNYIVSFSAKTNQNKTGSYTFLFCGRNAETVTVNQSTQSNPENPITIYDNKWVDITLSFNLNDISDEKLYGLDFMRKTDDSYAYLYVRHLKIELGDVATDFCEADEDLLYYGKGQLLNESTRSLDSGVTTEIYKDYDNIEKKCYRFSYTASESSITDVVKYEYKTEVGIRPLTANIVAGKVYTLSFWAVADDGTDDCELHARFCILPTTTEIINNIGIIISQHSINNKGYITEGISKNGETNIYITEYWTQFFIHFYATNTVSYNNITSLNVLQLLGDDNSDWNGNVYFCDFMFQEGYVLESSSFVSKIEQNARCISLAQQTGLTKAGIDIYNGKVDVQADQFTIRNSSGQENMSVNESGDVEFRGVIKGTYNFKVQTYDTSNSSISNTIDLDTDYFMFPGTNGSYSATLQDPRLCPGRVINVIKNNRPTQNEVLLQNYDSEIPFIWYDNTTQPSKGPIDFYYYQKVVVWSDPELLAKTVWGWRVIDSIKY